MTLFLQSVVFYFVLLTLLLACTGNLVPKAVDLGEYFKLPPSTYKDKVMPYIIALDVALVWVYLVLFTSSFLEGGLNGVPVLASTWGRGGGGVLNPSLGRSKPPSLTNPDPVYILQRFSTSTTQFNSNSIQFNLFPLDVHT